MTPEQEKILIETSEAVKRMEIGMLGNEYVKGAIPRLNSLEMRFNEHEKKSDAKKNQNRGIVIALTTIWTGVVLFLTEAIQWFKPK